MRGGEEGDEILGAHLRLADLTKGRREARIHVLKAPAAARRERGCNPGATQEEGGGATGGSSCDSKGRIVLIR